MSDEPDIKSIRKRLKLTQEQIADRLGVDRSSISHFEKGRAVRGPTLKLLQVLAAEAALMPDEVDSEQVAA